jgi:hypothetical protein
MTTPYTNNKGDNFLIVGLIGHEENLTIGTAKLLYSAGTHSTGLVTGQIDLPPGKWGILFRYSERTESDAAELVDDLLAGGVYDFKYRNYLPAEKRTSANYHGCKTALESLSTLMDSLKCWQSNPYPDTSCGCLTEFDREGCPDKCWQRINAQPHVHGDYIILKEVEG